ncbi:hypothetical protein KIH87_09400 [Paraneptunicella aestuarii]|uniref:hypothetical protein n=1 Tax=Paraneptunicella aestuarii TaxID=2831148 RepID=UPI001E349EAD|nr:hypothetical protein [Paraneptunicella aestuarii]UAA40528.1 hypothetical protein KIH87_09400 [Paraneptunicella aestuarii]
MYFDRDNRFQTLTIRNNSDEPIVYSVKINHVDMTEDGRILPVADEGKVEKSARSLVRYSPRSGSILPGGSQILRFTIKKPPGLENGEYRSQLRIEGALQNDPQMMAAKIVYNLPIIVRHGQTSAKASMDSFKIVKNQKGEDELHLMLKRSGNRSTFGAFTVINGEGDIIGQTKGVSVYEPLEKRLVKVPLNGKAIGEITVNYEELVDYGGDIKMTRKFSAK